MRTDLYVSVDVETDGPTPGMNSMLSLGAAAFHAGSRVPLGTFEVNLLPLQGANPDPDTMTWWARQDPAVWEHATRNPTEPVAALSDFVSWVRSLVGNPVLVVYPSWDAMWVHYYLGRFLGKDGNPFGIGALDVKSMAFGMGTNFMSFKDVTKRNMAPELFEGCPPHTHKAVDDALGQGIWFVNLLAARR